MKVYLAEGHEVFGYRNVVFVQDMMKYYARRKFVISLLIPMACCMEHRVLNTEFLLQFIVRCKVATNQPRCACADAVLFQRSDRGAFQHRIVGKTKVIVAGEIEELAPIKRDARSLGGLDVAERTV